MGICRFCGQSAGILRSTHSECEVRHSSSVKRIRAELTRSLHSMEGYDSLGERIERFSRAGRVSPAEVQAEVVAEWEGSVERFLDDAELSVSEEQRLIAYIEHFGLQQANLDRHGAYTKLTKAGAIRDLLDGRVPKRFLVQTPLPINLSKDEAVLWAFEACQYFEDRTKTTYVGRSQGVSIRLMKGVYYRTGGFKGESHRSTVRELVDSGLLVLTERNMYFVGPRKSLRLPYSKIVSFHHYSDGIGVVRDAANARTQVFVTGDLLSAGR